jgi:hypothetical protein
MFILVLCLVAVFCLAPLGVYLLWLAFATRRDQPTVVSGTWDFVGLVGGLSGFLLFGGGLLLALVDSHFRWYWLRGNFASLRDTWGRERVVWLLTVLFYLSCVIGWIALTIASRRRSLVVYNIDPAAFEGVLAEVFEQLNRPLERRGDLWMAGGPLFEVDRNATGRTVILRWISDDRRLFQDVERLVREGVRTVSPDENPATRWLMAMAVTSGVLASVFFGVVAYALSNIR